VKTIKCHLPGKVDEREKDVTDQSILLNIILSGLEALGLTQLEFMFQSVPVITSAVGGQSWQIFVIFLGVNDGFLIGHPLKLALNSCRRPSAELETRW